MIRVLSRLAGAIALAASVAFSSQAALITVNGTSLNVDAVNINEISASSFNNLYSNSQFSANTGWEIANEMITFIAEFNNQFAIYSIFSDRFDANTGTAGSLTFSATGAGVMMFRDDPGETTLGDTVLYNWAADRTDGLIWGTFSAESINTTHTFADVVGLNGITVYSFDANNTPFIAGTFDFIDDGAVIRYSSVSTPATLGMLTLALCAIWLRRCRE
ncbi:hypothetical protein [Alteromonas antoniana]|uniref:hypothetical protein n=1 Tax=Alteromonas antoniana TaxID=2803813 RepID=UPI001C49734D|nr:hypothetical protein [Alteromonas antoniana]